MTGFQLDCENLDDHLLPADVVPGSEWLGNAGEGEKAGGRYAADLVLATAGLVLTGSAALLLLHNIVPGPPASITTLVGSRVIVGRARRGGIRNPARIAYIRVVPE